MNYPLVSIIVPTYNRADKINNCIESLLNNDYPSYEIIVVDNNSTDNTEKIVKERYENKLIYVKLNENTGASGGRNAGMRYAKGDYFCFVDSDNIVEKDFLSIMMKYMLADEKIGVIGPIMYFYNNKSKVFYSETKMNFLTSQTIYVRRDDYREDLIPTNHIPNLFLVRKKAVIEVGIQEPYYHTYYEEADWHNRIAKMGYKILTCTKSKDYHDVPYGATIVNNRGDYYLYNMAKNRIIFMKRFAKPINFIFFLLTINNLLLIYHIIICLLDKKPKLIFSYLKGFIKGLKDSFKFKYLKYGNEDKNRLKL